MFQRQTKNRDNNAGLRRHRPDYLILLFMGILSLIGLIVLFSISPARVEVINSGADSSLDANHFMEKQILYLVIGLTAFVTTATVSVKYWRMYREKILWFALGASGLLAILGFLQVGLAQCTAGACRWYNLGPISFQPAELLKFAIIIFLAGFLAQRIATKRLDDVHNTLIPVGLLLAVSLILIVGAQRDMGTGIVLVGIVASMLFIANMKLKYFALAALTILGAMVLFIATAPHRLERIATFLAPTEEMSGAGYHIHQAKMALGVGGLTGKGLGNGVTAFGYLPEAPTDSIFAILGELFGFIGVIAIMAVILGLLLRLLKVIDNIGDDYMKLLVAGIFGWIATQATVNIGAMLGVFPLTGVPLPFLSFGGTSLLFIMAALGVAFQVSKYTTHAVDNERKKDEGTRSGRGIRGSRDSGTRGYQRAW
jgi:cell division protein FtsW